MMLSKESEKFLREFRVELMTRGKDEETRAELEAELKDYLIEAEADGKTLDDVTNGSVEAYIDSISEEVPFENKIGRVVGVAALGLFLLLIIPDFLNGTFEFTVSHLIYLIVLFVLAPLGIIAFLKHIIVEHTDFKEEKIEKMGYVKLTVASILFMGLLVGGIMFYREIPIYEFLTLDLGTTRIIGYVLFAVSAVVFLVLRQWIILGALLVVSLPQIIAIIFSNGNPGDERYILITAISLFVLMLVFVLVSLVGFRKKDIES